MLSILSVFSDTDFLTQYTSEHSPFYILSKLHSNTRVYSYQTDTFWLRDEDIPNTGTLFFKNFPVNIIMEVEDLDSGGAWYDDSTDYDLSAILNVLDNSGSVESRFLLYNNFDTVSTSYIRTENTDLYKSNTYDSGMMYGYLSIENASSFYRRIYSQASVKISSSSSLSYYNPVLLNTNLNEPAEGFQLEVWLSKNDHRSVGNYITLKQDNLGPQTPILYFDKYKALDTVYVPDDNIQEILYTADPYIPLYFITPTDPGNDGEGSGYSYTRIVNIDDESEIISGFKINLGSWESIFRNIIVEGNRENYNIPTNRDYKLVHYDKIGNASENYEFSVIHDNVAPIIENIDISRLVFKSSQETRSYSIELNQENNRIKETGSGLSGADIIIYKEDEEGNYIQFGISQYNDQFDSFISADIPNFSPGEKYKLGFILRDRVGNETSEDEIVLSNSFGLPELPGVGEDTEFVWLNNNVSLKLVLQVPEKPVSDIIFNIPLLSISEVKKTPGNWIEKDGKYQTTLTKIVYNFNNEDYFHKPISVAAKMEVHGIEFETSLDLPPINNRKPTLSMVEISNEILTSFNGKLVPSNDVVAYSESADFEAFPKFYYKSYDNDFACAEEDFDGDILNLVNFYGNSELFYIHESFTFTNSDNYPEPVAVDNYYILPYRFIQDESAPSWNPAPITLRPLDGQTLAVKNTVSYINNIPSGFYVPCEDEASGISSVRLEPDRELNGFLSGKDCQVEVDENGMYIIWPWNDDEFNLAEGSTFHGLFNFYAVDGVGNISSSQPLEFYIDKEKPDIPNQREGWIYQDEGDIRISISDGNIILDWHEYLEGKESHELSKITLSNYSTNPEDDNYFSVVGSTENNITFKVPDNVPGNSEKNVYLLLEDIAGNSKEIQLSYSTPAIFNPDDILMLGSEKSPKDYSGSLEYDFILNKEKSTVEWDHLHIQMDSNGEWIEWNGDGSTELHFSHSPHAESIFHIIPVNKSGIANLAAFEEEGITVFAQNYPPIIAPKTELLHSRDEHIYLQPNSIFNVEVTDYDEDACTTEIKINGELMYSRDSAGLEVLREDGDFTFSLNNFYLDFVNGETYNVEFITRDSQPENNECSHSFSFIYDSAAPAISSYKPTLEELEDLWGFHVLEVTSNDDNGAGLKSVSLFYEGIEQDPDILIADEGSFFDDVPLTHVLPEGEYDLSIKLEDALGQYDTPLILPIRNDISKPNILSTELTAASEIPVIDGVSLYNSNNVRTQIHWIDNLSNISRLEYRYLKDGTELFRDSKLTSPLKNMFVENHDTINCSIPKDYITEKDIYQLQVQITDEGGNISDWFECDFKISFDFSSPVIDEVIWDLLRKEGSYISTSNRVDFPEIRVSDNMGPVEMDELNIHYILLDREEAFIADCVNHIDFPEAGSYILRIQVEDKALLTAFKDVNLVFDNRGPQNLSINWINGSPLSTVPSQTVQLQLKAEDDYLSIDYFELEVNDGSNVYRQIQLPYSNAYYSLSLPDELESSSDFLNLTLVAVDTAGNRSEEYLQRISRIYPESFMTFSGKPFLGLDNMLSLQWNYFPEDEISHYNLSLMGIKADESSHIIWEGFRESPALSMDLSTLDIDLSDYHAVLLIVRPVNIGGQALEVYSSDRVLTDFLKPVVLIETDRYCIEKDINISWSIEEDNPIVEGIFFVEEIEKEENENVLQYTIRDSASFSNIKSEGSLDLSPYFDSLDIENMDTIRIGLRVCDIAGNFTTVYTPAIRVDHSPAPSFGVFDQGDYINPIKNELVFNWFWAETDPEAGEQGYYYQLNTVGVPIDEPWLFTTEREVYFDNFPEESYPNGIEIFLFVKRQNETGIESIQSSNGIIIDRSKPVITQVSVNSTIEILQDIIQYSDKENVFLNIRGYDPDSGINRYSYRSGLLDSGTFSSTQEYTQSTVDLFESTLPTDYPAGSILAFEAICYNGAEEESLPSYSPGILFAPEDPILDNVISSYTDGSVHVSWSAASMIPIMSQKATLFSVDGQEIYETESLASGIRNTSIDQPLSDGVYIVEVQFTDYSGAVTTGRSNIIQIDTTLPEIVEVKLSSFIYRDLSASFQTSESIDEYRIELKCMGNIVSSVNVQTEAPIKHIFFEKDLRNSIFWMLMNETESLQFQLTLYVKDLAGNWSLPNNYILEYDGSKPEIVSLDFEELYWKEEPVQNPYTAHLRDRIENVSLHAKDLQSGIAAYRCALVGTYGENPSQWNLWNSLEEPVITLLDSNLVLNLPSMQHSKKYVIAFQVQNQAGISSDIFWSEEFDVDLSSPEFDLDFGDETVFSVSPVEAHIIITEVTLPFFKMNYFIYQPDGSEVFSESRDLDATNIEGSTISIPIDTNIPGNWKVKMSLQDLFGRTNSIARNLPVNGGPVFNIPEEITCYPGEEFSLDIRNWISDSQGISTVVIEEATPGILSPISTQYLWSDLDSLEFVLEHTSDTVQETEYIYNLKAKDTLGAESETQFVIKVINSRDGTLARDEYWSGEHYITGTIVVPSGVTLTLAPDTHVRARSGGLYGEDQGIVIESGAHLVLEGSAYFGTDGVEPAALWNGITFMESHDLDSITIEKARIALLIAEGVQMTISYSSFLNNEIGLHLFSNLITVRNCNFQHNRFYGVKEEINTNPLMLENRFGDNGFDYYDFNKSVINASEINNLSEDNELNAREGE